MPQKRPERRLEYKAWKRGRAVEGTGLENRRRSDLFVSSNLTASANLLEALWKPSGSHKHDKNRYFNRNDFDGGRCVGGL